MRHDTRKIPIPSAPGAGAPIPIGDFEQCAVFAGKAGASPVNVTGTLQGSVDGLDQWFDIAALDNDDFVNGLHVTIEDGYTRVRFTTATFTSGDAVLIFSGKNTRTA